MGEETELEANVHKLLDGILDRAEKPMSDWQLIETAPTDGTVIDVWLGDCDESDRHFYCTAQTKRAPGWHWMNGKFRPYINGLGLTTFVAPTHWQPLPEPPQ